MFAVYKNIKIDLPEEIVDELGLKPNRVGLLL